MLKKRLSLVLTLGFIAAFIVYFFQNRQSFSALLGVSAFALAMVALAKTAVHFNSGVFMKWTVEVFTGRLPLIDGIYVALLSAIGNFFGPLLGGTTVRAVYLKKAYKLPYSYFTSTLAGYYVILFSVSGTLTILSLLGLPSSAYRSSLLTFFGSWVAILFLLMLVRLPQQQRLGWLAKNRLGQWFVKVLYEVEDGWRQLVARGGILPRLVGLAVASFAISFATAWVEFRAIGVAISLPALGVYAGISLAAMLVSLTPGAIGIRESLLLLASSVMGITTEEVLQVSVIDRGVSFMVLGLLYLALKVFKISKTTRDSNNQKSTVHGK